VVPSLFNLYGNVSGSIEVSSDVPVIVTARTYSESDEGTFGQYLPGASPGQGLSLGKRGVVPQLKKTPDFRCNVGFLNLGSSTCSVRVTLYSANGNQLGASMTTSVGAGQWKQINDVFGEAGVNQCELGYAIVEVLTADGLIWAYASVVDNRTDDPTTIPVFVQ
jgi:hypothetical protein